MIAKKVLTYLLVAQNHSRSLKNLCWTKTETESLFWNVWRYVCSNGHSDMVFSWELLCLFWYLSLYDLPIYMTRSPYLKIEV